MTSTQTMMPTAPDATAIMRALGDPTRREIYEQIVQRGEASVLELTERSRVSQPAVSQHLKALRIAGLVAERRTGRNAFYRPQPSGLAPLVDWLDHYSAFWRDRMVSLRTLLEEIDPK